MFCNIFNQFLDQLKYMIYKANFVNFKIEFHKNETIPNASDAMPLIITIYF